MSCQHTFVALKEGDWFCNECELFLSDHPDVMKENEIARQREMQTAVEESLKEKEWNASQARWAEIEKAMKEKYLPVAVDRLNQEGLSKYLRESLVNNTWMSAADYEEYYKSGTVSYDSFLSTWT